MVPRDAGRGGKRKWGQEGQRTKLPKCSPNKLSYIGTAEAPTARVHRQREFRFLATETAMVCVNLLQYVSSYYPYIAFNIILFVLTRLNEKF